MTLQPDSQSTIQEYVGLTAIDISIRSNTHSNLNSLLKSYKCACTATAQFERSAATLGASSYVLKLCRKLVSEDIPRAITCYEDIPERDFPARPAPGAYREFELRTETLVGTCSKVLAELDRIDVVAVASSYYRYAGFPGIRYISETVFRKNSHGHEGVGTCCAYLDYVSAELTSSGVREGLKALIKEQDHFQTTFMRFAIIAAFFSGILASALQLSIANANSTHAWSAVNVCWFASLVLSVASAANSILGAIANHSSSFLRQSNTARRRFLQKWFIRFPPLLLAVSGALFLSGLCSLTFSQSLEQGVATQVTTTSLSAINFVLIVTASVLALGPVI